VRSDDLRVAINVIQSNESLRTKKWHENKEHRRQRDRAYGEESVVVKQKNNVGAIWLSAAGAMVVVISVSANNGLSGNSNCFQKRRKRRGRSIKRRSSLAATLTLHVA